jgi:hypothetical protein
LGISSNDILHDQSAKLKDVRKACQFRACGAREKCLKLSLANTFIGKIIHPQPKKVEAKIAAAYKEASAQTFLRPGNSYP